MGTSSSNRGPSGRTSLLPTWYDGGNNDTGQTQPADTGSNDSAEDSTGDAENQSPNEQVKQQSLPNITADWKDAKGAFTRYASNTRGSNIRKSARTYVRTYGGAKGATRSASKGISAGRGLVSFLGSVSAPGAGLNKTLTDLGLQAFIGSSSEEALAKIADAIAPTGSTNDEAIARDAVISTLDQLYTKILDQNGDLTSLEKLTPEMIKETVIDYVGNYIYKKWVYELGLAIERNAVTEKEAIEMEADIKVFIRAEVKLSLKDKPLSEFDLRGKADQQLIENIFQMAYSTLER